MNYLYDKVVPNYVALFIRKANGWLTLLWIIPGIPISIYFRDSIAFLVFLSVYAIITGHLSTWQSARVEVRQDEIHKENKQ